MAAVTPEVILEPKKIKSVTASTFSPSICLEIMGPDAMILVFFNVKLQASFVKIPSFCFPPAVNTDQITRLQRCHVVPGKQPAGLVILCWAVDGRCHCSLCSDRWGLVRDTHGSHFPESRRLIVSVDSLSMTWLQLIIVRQVLGILAKLCRTVPRLVNVQPVMLLQGQRAWLCCH